MVLMAEALDSLDDPYAIYGFSSEGRHRVDLFVVKDFAEPYNERVQFRLGNLEPLGLTRMGAVLRHGRHRLDSTQAAVKLMVILTDGRPYDLEYGNLDYAITDTRKAVQEVRQARIHPFIITSDKKSSDYLKRITPETQSIIVEKVERLPRLLPAIYKRLTV
jgi:nitric oxide reductase activation protein